MNKYEHRQPIDCVIPKTNTKIAISMDAYHSFPKIYLDNKTDQMVHSTGDNIEQATGTFKRH